MATDSNWTDWTGGNCPELAGTRVDVKFRNGGSAQNLKAQLLYWKHDGDPEDIVAYCNAGASA